MSKIYNAIINNVTRTFSDRFLNIISQRSNNVLVTLLTRHVGMCSIRSANVMRTFMLLAMADRFLGKYYLFHVTPFTC